MAKKVSGDDSGDRPGNGNIYILLVGINTYQNITDLSGCITDLNRIESFLRQFWSISPGQSGLLSSIPNVALQYKVLATPIEGYDSLNICRLENEQATYANILDGFRHFLSLAGANDSVWFHFSGHGSEAPTAEVFQEMENGKDQGLMCTDYQLDDGGQYSGFLADKELGILLEELTSKEAGVPHVLVTLDCCHSGGGTRSDIVIRNVEVKTDQARPLENYYLGAFKNAIKAGNLDLPAPPHVVMTACTNLQLAGESAGGFFTTALIDALESVPGPGLISYADLLIRTRAAVRSKEHTQTPQFEVLGGLKAYALFLQGFPYGDPDRYEIGFKNGSFFVGVGAIHGLPTTAEMQKMATAGRPPIALEIFSYETGADNSTPAVPSQEGDPISDRSGKEEGNGDAPAIPAGSEKKANAAAEGGGLLKSLGRQHSTMEFKRSNFAVRLHIIDFEQVDDSQALEGALIRKIDDQYSTIEFRRSDLGIKIEVFDLEKGGGALPAAPGQLAPISVAGGNGTNEPFEPRSGGQNPTIQQSVTSGKLMGKALIKEVGPQFSTIELLTENLTFEGDAYYGVLNYLPADPEFVLVDGPAAEVQALLEAARDFTKIGAKNIHLIDKPDPLVAHELKVSIGADLITIRDLRIGQLVDREYEKHNVEEIFIDLIQIVNWRRMLALENPNPQSKFKDKISLEVEIGNATPSAAAVLQGEAVEFIAKAADRLVRPLGLPEDRYYRITPKVTLQEEQEEELFFYLFSLYSFYGIRSEDERKKKDTGPIIYNHHDDWGLDQGQDRDTMYFKLIVTSEEIDYHQFLQDGIYSDRGRPTPRVKVTNGFKDWAAITMKLEMVREEAADSVPP